MGKRVTLSDIAGQVGTSVVTVSNALSGKSGVSEALRGRILQTAQELGYRRAAEPERAGELLCVGVIVDERFISPGNSFYWALYQEVVRAVAAQSGISMLETVDRRMQREGELPLAAAPGQNSALICIGPLAESYLERLLDSVRVPVVLLDAQYPNRRARCVVSGNYTGMYRMTRYLIRRGHRQIGFVGSPADNDNLLDRYFGYRRAMEEAGLFIRPDWVIPDREPGEKTVSVSLPQELPTAFVCSSDFSASLTSRELERRGLSVPEDVSLVGYDDFLLEDPLSGRLTTLRVDLPGMAACAVRMLAEGGMQERVRILDGTLVERSSVRDLHAGGKGRR